MDIEKKRQKEIEIVSLMIHLYCRYHDDIDEQELIGYAAGRIEKCPMMQKKTVNVLSIAIKKKCRKK